MERLPSHIPAQEGQALAATIDTSKEQEVSPKSGRCCVQVKPQRHTSTVMKVSDAGHAWSDHHGDLDLVNVAPPNISDETASTFAKVAIPCCWHIRETLRACSSPTTLSRPITRMCLRSSLDQCTIAIIQRREKIQVTLNQINRRPMPRPRENGSCDLTRVAFQLDSVKHSRDVLETTSQQLNQTQ